MLKRILAGCVALLVSAVVQRTASASDRERWVMVDGDETSMSGSTRDLRRARHAATGVDGPYLWFTAGDAEYLVTDGELLRRIHELFEPQILLGRKQGELGKQQGELGKRQGRLGKAQARIGMQMEDGSARKLGERMRALGEEQRLLGDQQRALGDQQRALGEQQRRLSEELRPKLQALFGESIRNGLARRIGG